MGRLDTLLLEFLLGYGCSSSSAKNHVWKQWTLNDVYIFGLFRNVIPYWYDFCLAIWLAGCSCGSWRVSLSCLNFESFFRWFGPPFIIAKGYLKTYKHRWGPTYWSWHIWSCVGPSGEALSNASAYPFFRPRGAEWLRLALWFIIGPTCQLLMLGRGPKQTTIQSGQCEATITSPSSTFTITYLFQDRCGQEWEGCHVLSPTFFPQETHHYAINAEWHREATWGSNLLNCGGVARTILQPQDRPRGLGSLLGLVILFLYFGSTACVHMIALL